MCTFLNNLVRHNFGTRNYVRGLFSCIKVGKFALINRFITGPRTKDFAYFMLKICADGSFFADIRLFSKEQPKLFAK